MAISELDVYEFVAAQTDFCSADIYDFLYNLGENTFLQAKCEHMLKERASELNFKSFDKMYKAWKKENAHAISGEIDLSDLPVQLDFGGWKFTEDGIILDTNNGPVNACGIPVVPQERLIDIDTSEESVTIWFKVGSKWDKTTIRNSVWSSNSKVIALANTGIPVTSYNASSFVRYMTDIYTRNITEFPIKQCVSRCGHHEGFGFAPFCDNVQFCGDSSYASLFNAISEHGYRDESINAIREACSDSTYAQILISASLASVLVEPLGKLPFICHLWGIDSGTGKTVAEMCAASIWANPSVGEYIKTFDSTAVGHERMLDFLNQMPLILDELQLAKDKFGNYKVDPYKLTEGTGRSRSNIYGGVDRPTRWRNSIVSCGESPLTNASSNAGAVNRIIDIQIQNGDKVIKDGRKISNAVRNNFGFIGKEFVEYIYSNLENIKKADDALVELLMRYGTDKQASSMAAILLADRWLCNLTGLNPIEIQKATEFIVSNEMVSTGKRALEWLSGWISKNHIHFDSDRNVELYGKKIGSEMKGDIEYHIIKTVFDESLSVAGFNPDSVLSYLDSIGALEHGKGRKTKTSRIGDTPTRCVVIRNHFVTT